jgi:malonate transporter
MLLLLSVIAPVFILIGLGFFLGRQGVFTPDQTRGFGRFVLLVALPALLFKSLSAAPMAQVFRADYLLVYGLASLISFAIGFALFRRQENLAVSAVRAIGMSCTNSAFVGIPILSQLYGAAAAGPIVLNMLIENFIMLPLVLVLLEASEKSTHHWGALLGNVAKGLIRTPMIVAIALGCLFSLAGWALPTAGIKAIGLLANASAPLALVTIGASLAGVSLHGRRGAIGLITLGKLALHPALVLGLLLIMPIADPMFRTCIILLAAMPMVSIFPILAQRSDDAETCSAALLVATIGSFFTLIALMMALGVQLPTQLPMGG